MSNEANGPNDSELLEEAVDIVVRGVSEQLQLRSFPHGIPGKVFEPFAVGYLMGYSSAVAEHVGLTHPMKEAIDFQAERVFVPACLRIFGKAIAPSLVARRPATMSMASDDFMEGYEAGKEEGNAEVGNSMEMAARDNQRELRLFLYGMNEPGSSFTE